MIPDQSQRQPQRRTRPGRFWTRRRIRAPRTRRGTILLVAIGVLGILSVAAVSYVTIVQLDRRSSIIASRPESFRQQVNAVVEHIRAVLAADLFGNKIVTSSTPPTVWPGAFEDGETWDYPSTVVDPSDQRFTFNTNDPDQNPSNNAVLGEINIPGFPAPVRRTFEVGIPDDAWLASIDPYIRLQNATGRANVDENNVEFWPQITNLRAAYTWDASEEEWVRGDGRFVDLAQWILAYPDNGGFAQPGLDLRDWNEIGFGANPPAGELGPEFGVNQEVFNVQMHVMGEDDPNFNTGGRIAFFSPGNSIADLRFDAGDERHWVDTDGDGRPDARWTTLESLGNLFGLNWVVAARIIDANGLLNLNTAIELAADDPINLGTGQTPADVDLHRLLREAHLSARTIITSTNPYAGDVLVTGVDRAFKDHLELDVPMQVIVDDAWTLDDGDMTRRFGYNEPGGFQQPGVGVPFDWNASIGQRTTRLERYAHNHLFGNNNRQPIAFAAAHLPERDLVDLMAIWGVNSASLISPSEQRFDGDPANPPNYLPDGTDSLEYGPFRSRELPEDSLRFNDNVNNRAPNNEQLLDNNIRRLVTTVNGEGPISPIPVVNDAAVQTTGGQIVDAFSGIHRREKISLDDPLTIEETQRAFEAFVWALAPLATDHPLFRPTSGTPPAGGQHFGRPPSQFHYGGGMNGPVGTASQPGLRVASDIRNGNAQPGFNPDGQDFGLFTAMCLALNLRDAVDRNTAPSLGQFFFTPSSPTGTPTAPGAIRFDTRFAHGDVLSGAASRLIQAASPGSGVLFVGLERQPFLSEATTIAIYSDFDGSGTTTGDSGNRNSIIGDSVDDHVGSAIVVELSNPWSTELLAQDLFVQLNVGHDLIGDGSAGSVRMRIPNGMSIPAGGSRSVYVLQNDGSATWTTFLEPELRNMLPNDAVEGAIEFGGADPVMFQQLGETGDHNPVLLLTQTESAGAGGASSLVVIDRMSPNVAGDIFPRVASVVIGGASESMNNVMGPLDNAYFQSLTYPVSDARLNPNGPTGRFMVTSSLGRDKSIPSVNDTGFPAYVLEDASKNTVTTRFEGHAWLEPYDPANDPVTSRTQPDDLIRNTDPWFPVDFPANHWDHGVADASRKANGTWDSTTPPFQLFCPAPDAKYARGTADEPIRFSSLAELHMLCTYSHFYQSNDPIQIGQLTTVGEWLAQSRFYDFSAGSGAANPFMGTLDPTRFILNTTSSGMGTVNGLPNHLAVPLALRVFECFEVLPKANEDDPVQGRVNLNTAPNRVLQMLPYVDVNYPGLTVAPPFSQLGSSRRLQFIEQYRRSEELENATIEPSLITGINGLRFTTGPGPQTTGFVSIGELAILDQWEQQTPPFSAPLRPDTMTSPIPFGFGRLGFDSQNQVAEPFELITDYGRPEYNPIDDAEERLALFRALSNIVTTRSDVYICWFVLRGYDPETIEQINVGQNSTVQAALALMEDPTVDFRPAYESRWLAVLDRSNVRRPTDRPLIRMLIELPPVAFNPQVEE